MLKILRKHSKHWLIAVIIGAIVVVFIFWGIGGMDSPHSQEIARVYGQPIPVKTYVQYVNLLEKKSRFRRELSEEDIKALRDSAPDNLIRMTLLTETANRLGLKVSDTEVQAAIVNDPAFHHEGSFNPRLYDYFVGRGRYQEAAKVEFEKWLRFQLLAAKAAEAITSFAKVSEAELQDYFRLAREEVQVDYLVVSPEPFIAKVHPTEADLKAYFEQHQAEFRTPAKVKVCYLLFRSQDFLKQVEISPKAVEEYLTEHRARLVRPQVIRVREVFLALAPKASAAERRKVEQQAQNLLKQTLQGKDFAQLARAASQDKASRQKGGDLGLVKRGQKPKTWEKVAFAMAPGQVGLARTKKGFHLIKVEEIKEKEPLPEAEAKALALEKLTAEKSHILAKDEAKRLLAETARMSFTEMARKNTLTPKETSLFTRTEPIPGLGAVRAFNTEAFKLKVQEVGLTEVPQGFVLMQALERQAAAVPSFEDAKDRVRQAVARQRAKKMAAKEAESLLARLGKGEPLARVAAQAGLPLRDSGYFTRPQGFLGQPLAEPLTSAAFQLTKKQPYPAQPISWKGKYYLLAFKNRRLPSPEDFQQERENLERQLIQDKRRVLLEAWLREEWQRAQVSKPQQPS